MGTIGAKTLYRSSHPALDYERSPYAAQLAEQARIATIINLSDTDADLQKKAAIIPWYQWHINRKSIIAVKMGFDFESAAFLADLKTVFSFMSTHNKPFLVHCEQGKDRTGIVIAILGALMGASVDEIVDDYMQSYTNYYGINPGEQNYTAIEQIIIGELAIINNGKDLPRYDMTLIAENFLEHTVGLSAAQIAALKSKLGESAK